MSQRVRERDRGAERVAHERRPADPEGVEEAMQRRGEVAEPVLRARLRGSAEAREVERQRGRPGRQRRQGVAPRLGEAAQPVAGGGGDGGGGGAGRRGRGEEGGGGGGPGGGRGAGGEAGQNSRCG